MLALLLAVAVSSAQAPPQLFEPAVVRPGRQVQAVVLGPVFDRLFMCADHPEGPNTPGLGDAFGTDCVLVGGLETGIFRLFRTDGMTNEDWYTWRADVLAPFDGVVVRVAVNDETNLPGKMGDSLASSILIKRKDGVHVLYAHVTDIRVKAGERVRQGQVMGVAGNNGRSPAPHIHIGAFKGKQPLQIRWDQRLAGRMPGF